MLHIHRTTLFIAISYRYSHCTYSINAFQQLILSTVFEWWLMQCSSAVKAACIYNLVGSEGNQTHSQAWSSWRGCYPPTNYILLVHHSWAFFLGLVLGGVYMH